VSDSECRPGRTCVDGSCSNIGAASDDTDSPQIFDDFVADEQGTHISGYGSFADNSGRGFHVYLFAYPDRRAVVFYEEGFLGHGFNPRDAAGVRIDTDWREESGQMIVGEVLRCTPEEAQAGAELLCILQRRVMSDEAVGGTARLDETDWVHQVPPDATPEHEAFGAFIRE
jgi:hypothetical protein